jgi:hypothetical protein
LKGIAPQGYFLALRAQGATGLKALAMTSVDGTRLRSTMLPLKGKPLPAPQRPLWKIFEKIFQNENNSY